MDIQHAIALFTISGLLFLISQDFTGDPDRGAIGLFVGLLGAVYSAIKIGILVCAWLEKF